MCEISIIIPVYRVEDYLERCLDSILAQSFQNFEIIIVDDGSDDRSGEIADYYAEHEPRVSVIHKINGGAASARNAGIEISKGNYLYFPDSDDWIETEYLHDLYMAIRRTRAQLVISGFTMDYTEDNDEQHFSVEPKDRSYKTKNEVRHNLHKYFDNMMMAVPWNKLYKADYIKDNKIRFPSTEWDDLFFNMEVVRNIERVTILSSSGYHYFRSRKTSETQKVFDSQLYSKRRDQYLYIDKVYNYWNLNNKGIDKVIKGYYAGRLIQFIQEISISSLDENQKMNLVKAILNDELNHKAFSEGKIQSKLLTIAAIPARYRLDRLCILVGKGIGYIKYKNPKLFNRLKSISVNKAKERR